MFRQRVNVAIFLFVKDQSTDINTFKPRPNARSFATDIVKVIFLLKSFVVW